MDFPVKSKAQPPMALHHFNADILGLVGEFCGSDLLSLRLTCRSINNNTFSAFCRGFIRTQIVFVNVLPSLHQFLALSKYEPLRCHVRNVLLSDVRVGDLSIRTDKEIRAPSPKSVRVRDYFETERYLRYGYATQILSTAFAQFSNCAHVGLAPPERCLSQRWIMSIAEDIFGQTNVRRNEVRLRRSTDYVGIVSALLSALLHSNMQVESFKCYPDFPGILEWDATRQPGSVPFVERDLTRWHQDYVPVPKLLEAPLSNCLGVLRCLSLGLFFSNVKKAKVGYPLRKTFDAVRQMLLAAPNLTSLSLYMSHPCWGCNPFQARAAIGAPLPKEMEGELVDLIHAASLPKLKELVLADSCERPSWLHRSTVTEILCHFKKSLRRVTLSRLCFTDSVIPVITCLREELDLESLRLEQIDEHSYRCSHRERRRHCCPQLELVEVREDLRGELGRITMELSVPHAALQLPYSSCIDCNGVLVTSPPAEPKRMRIGNLQSAGLRGVINSRPQNRSRRQPNPVWTRAFSCVQSLPGPNGQQTTHQPIGEHDDASPSQAHNPIEPAHQELDTEDYNGLDIRASPSPPGSPNEIYALLDDAPFPVHNDPYGWTLPQPQPLSPSRSRSRSGDSISDRSVEDEAVSTAS